MLAIGLTHGQLHQIGHVLTAAMVAAATFTFSAWLGGLAWMYIHLAVNEGLSRLSEVNHLRFWLGVSDTGIPLSTLPRTQRSPLRTPHAARLRDLSEWWHTGPRGLREGWLMRHAGAERRIRADQIDLAALDSGPAARSS
jgi:hypothetical protein